MLLHRFFRGLLLVICAQIPLLGLFVYLLSMGVGIADFGKLAGSLRPDPKEFEVMLQAQEKKLADQMLGDVDRLSFKITQLETRLNDLSRIGPAWDKFIADGGLDSVAGIAKDLENISGDVKYLDERTASFDERIITLDERAISIDQRIASLDETMTQRLMSLVENLEGLKAATAARVDDAGLAQNQKIDELLKLYPTLYAPRPERKPSAELRFVAEDWEINRAAKSSLDKIVRTIKGSGSKTGISIYGFTVKQGSLNFSMALADKRARTVAQALRKKGVKNPIKIFVVPEYNTRDTRDKAATDKNHAVHIYLDEPSQQAVDLKGKS